MRRLLAPSSHRPGPAASTSGETARCGPGSREGEGWRLCSWGAGPAQRGQEARTPGIVSRSRSPAAAQPQHGRKFCRVLSAGASLAILLNRKPGSAGAERWRRERRTPSPRAPARTSGGEASEWTPRGAKAAPDREGAAEPRVVAVVPQVVGPYLGAPDVCSRSHRAGTGAARALGEAVRDGSPHPPRERERRRAGPVWGQEGPQHRPRRWRRCGSRRRGSGRREPPGEGFILKLQGSSPLPTFLPFSPLFQGRGRRRGPGILPPETKPLRSGGRLCRGNPLRAFPGPAKLRRDRARGGRRWARSR